MSKISIRSMIIAPPGKILVAADLSQAESWIVAYRAHEPNMQWSLNHSDIHTDTAASLFFDNSYDQHKWLKKGDDHICQNEGCGITIIKPARYIGKRYNHASGYRMKPPRAAQVINKDSDKPPYVTVTLGESKMYSERWHKRYNLKTWWREIEEILDKTRTITTVYGRSRMFFGAWGEELFREATAHEPQSTVADHFNGAVHPQLGIEGGLRSIFRNLVKPYKDRSIINQSHDSFIAEVPIGDGEDFCQESMKLLHRPLVIDGVEFTIPVDGEIGERWGEMESRKLAA